MSKLRNKVIAITMGDPAGIGPEIIAKALRRVDVHQAGHFILVGDAAIFRHYLPKRLANVAICDVPIQGVVHGGKPNAQGGLASLHYLEKAIALVRDRVVDGLVTGPVCKESVALARNGFAGHTEFLAGAFNVTEYDMMFATPHLRTVIVTRHVPLKDVPGLITVKRVHGTIDLVHRSLKNLFKIQNPSIAVLGLNPHAGENGLMGHEERKAIIPAILKATNQGMRVKGPFPADTFFAHGVMDYDCVVAMYHDQGLIPMKTVYFKEVVNVTLGLPFVRTSPAHGTAFDIAGKNKADASSMAAAITLACQLT